MGTRALSSHSFFFSPLGGFAFQVIVKLVFLWWSVCGASHSAFVSVDHLRSSSTPSYPCVCFLLLLHCSSRGPLAFAPRVVLVCLGHLGVLISTVIPLLYPLFVCFIDASSRVNRKWICSLLLPLLHFLSFYLSTKQGHYMAFKASTLASFNSFTTPLRGASDTAESSTNTNPHSLTTF